MGLIYKIENHINNKVYIGQTIHTISRRYNGTSMETIYKNMHNVHLKKSMKKYGLDNFSIEVLVESDSIDKLNEYEEYYINVYNSMEPDYGYNKRAGGENNKASEELKQRFSEIQTELKGVKVICINNNQVFSSFSEAAREYNVPLESIRAACKDHLKGATSAGMQWDYYVEGKIYKLYDKIFYNEQPVICINSKVVYKSISEAERKTGLGGIGACCRGEIHTVGGMQWSYYKDGEEYELKEIVYNTNGTPVICIGTQVVYNSMSEAEELTEATNISSVVLGKRDTSGGLHWDYYDEDREYSLEDYAKERVPVNRRKVICLNTGVIYKSVKEAQTTLNINNVSMACRGITSQAGGMEWAYWVEGKPYRPKTFISKKKPKKEKVIKEKKLPKKVICIDTQEIFNNMEDAAKKYNVTMGSIHKCCIGESKTCVNMQWSFWEEGKVYKSTKIDYKDSGKPKKQVLCVELGKIYNSLSEADKDLGISFKNISACCRGKRAKAGGYTWRFL
ncbi:NUMOD1 domain-containing DNA-binding protein [Bacillus paranthracis]|uniref:NUMOD1 domain-containing DNA-binding protein n=1 Tax=Bacillus paranthracis TaxID=2026186 RepID=UPI0021511CB1|nr:NUMOD1 domain-containing DNA-binding protein [Bacillus paranthracis]MCR6462283.1 NUMOD1 domain-containing DNA-binding protein [Bacillus paranthracis]MCR9022731.1 NUMOD1 domain-containing DNA-binding protein [Bacillus paranthracis]